jgi:hypothetical protein
MLKVRFILRYTLLGMKVREIQLFPLKVEAFLPDVILSICHRDRRHHAGEYIRAVLMDAERE